MRYIISLVFTLVVPACGGDGGGGSADDLRVSGYALSGPSFSPDGSMLAFAALSSSDDAVEEIAIAQRDGSGFTVLATADTYLANTAFTPDGAYVVYTADGGLYRVPVAGGDSELLVDAFASISPDVSPDGSRLVYGVNGSYIWTAPVEPDATAEVLGDASGSSPKFSPDGQRIAYFSGDDIRVIDVTGENDTLVLEAANDFLGSLDWLSDTEIVFVGSDSIDSIDIVTGERIAHRDEFVALDLAASADGSAVAYASNPASSLTVLAIE